MSDVFHKEQIELDMFNKQLVNAIKNKSQSMFDTICGINNREMAIAKTKLEEFTMWATKAVCVNQEAMKEDK